VSLIPLVGSVILQHSWIQISRGNSAL